MREQRRRREGNRWWHRFRRGRGPRGEVTPDLDDPGLTVVAESFAVGEADSAALARASAWSPGRPAVLRHHLLLPADRVPEATALLAPDGWDVREAGREGDRIRVHALRADRLDALLCARERARMAGLAQRLGGDALGWDALQPPG